MSNVIEAVAGLAGQSIHNEALSAAGSAIQAGHVVEETATGTVQEHSSAGAISQKLIALTNLSNGGSTADTYAVGETVRYGAFHAGQVAFVRVAAGTAAIARGAAVDSVGNGTVKTAAGGGELGYALEPLDNSGGATDLFIKVRIS